MPNVTNTIKNHLAQMAVEQLEQRLESTALPNISVLQKDQAEQRLQQSKGRTIDALATLDLFDMIDVQQHGQKTGAISTKDLPATAERAVAHILQKYSLNGEHKIDSDTLAKLPVLGQTFLRYVQSLENQPAGSSFDAKAFYSELYKKAVGDAETKGKLQSIDIANVVAPHTDLNQYPHYNVTPPGLTDVSKTVYNIEGQLYLRQSGMGPQGRISQWFRAGEDPMPTLARVSVEQSFSDRSVLRLRGTPPLPSGKTLNDFPHYEVLGQMDIKSDVYLIGGVLYMREPPMQLTYKTPTRWFILGPADKYIPMLDAPKPRPSFG